MISANEQVKMWGCKVFISYSNINRVEVSHPSQSSLTRFFRFIFFVVIIWVGLKEKLNFVIAYHNFVIAYHILHILKFLWFFDVHYKSEFSIVSQMKIVLGKLHI